MTIDNKLFEDLTRVASGAATVFVTLGKQLGEGLKDQVGEKFAPDFMAGNSAANDDIDRLQGVVTKLRIEQEDMKKRIAELEAMLGKKVPAAKTKVKTKISAKTKASPAKKVAPKKAVVKKAPKKRA